MPRSGTVADLPFLFTPSPSRGTPTPVPPPAPKVSLIPSAEPNGSVSLPTSLEAIIRHAHDHRYSDVHLGVGEEPRFRDRGEILRTGWPATDAACFRDWLKQLLSPGEIDAFLREKDFDGAQNFPFVRVRINLMEALRGPAMVLRLIPNTVASIEDLNLPSVLKALAERPKGLLLVTGPTGSGKSTTLAAVIDYINRSMKRHILTIEDPVEFVHASQLSLVHQREVGYHTKEFSTALRAALREDPDVILIGEIRDKETLATALEASQTGHLVLGTMHTNSAVRTVERILGLVPPQEQEVVRRSVSESLLGVISQGLIRTMEGGRVAFHDLFVNTDACRDYIVRGEIEEIEEIMNRSSFDGMITMNHSLARLVEDGKVQASEALALSPRATELSQTLRGRV
jgi:twitching motility protein PilT